MNKYKSYRLLFSLLLLQAVTSCSLFQSSTASSQVAGIDNADKSASIGASIGVAKNGWLHLIDFVEGGPAANSKALLHGDHLVGIKGDASTQEFVMVHTLKKEEVIGLIRGAKGSEITLWVVRDFQSYYVVLVRDTIINKTGTNKK